MYVLSSALWLLQRFTIKIVFIIYSVAFTWIYIIGGTWYRHVKSPCLWGSLLHLDVKIDPIMQNFLNKQVLINMFRKENLPHLNKRLDSQTDLSQLQTFAVTFMFNVSLWYTCITLNQIKINSVSDHYTILLIHNWYALV